MREPRNIGYARVSTKEQNLERQIQALVSAGVDETDIYKDKASGKDFKRDKWQELTREKLIEGDTLFILSLDRMGRDWKEISKEWEYVTQTKKANIVILDMPLLDTRKNNDLTGDLIAKLVMELLSYVAQIEREKIKERQKQGIAVAKANGVKFGRQAKPLPDNFDKITTKWVNGELSAKEAYQALDMSSATFYRICKAKGIERKEGYKLIKVKREDKEND